MTQNVWARTAPTIAEVANAAGVSRATVSRVMNGRVTVDPDLAQRVREVAERLQYRPSNVARSLSLGRTNTVAVVVPDLANPMFQQVLRGVAGAAGEAGYRVLVADTSESEVDEQQVALDARTRCDALVLVSPRMPEATLRTLLQQVGPVVVVNREQDGITSTLTIDYAAGVEDIVEHLVGLGHRHLLYLAGPPSSASHLTRLGALRAAAARLDGVRLSERAAGPSVESGYAAAEDVLASRATAVVAYNDLVAFGLLARLNELGVAVPAEISVTGFDDIEFARFAVPSMTTAAVPQRELGRLAWQHLAALVAGDHPDPSPAAIRPVLAVRASTGPVPPGARLEADHVRLRSDSTTSVLTTTWAEGDAATLTGVVRVGPDDDVRIPLAHYDTGTSLASVHSPRPFLHPVRSACGVALTQTSPVDHRHHYGVSMAVASVNGTSHWGGRTFLRDEGPTLLPNHGRQDSLGVRFGDDGTTLVDRLVWRDEHGRPQLREERRITASPLDDASGWAMRWTSVLDARHGAVRIESPATNGRPGAGYGGIFWRLPSADATTVLGEGLVGEDAVHGSSSPWLALVQRREQATTTLLLVQPTDVRPWFVRVREYVGAGPALAWDAPLGIAAGDALSVGLAAVVVDRALTEDECAELAGQAWA